MNNQNLIDLNEKVLYEKNPKILEILLFDQTTKKNIIWATDSYLKKGYHFKDRINIESIVNSNFIMPRAKKSKSEQIRRSKDNAEVFTPSWICNKQNNLIDKSWFGRDNIFNIEKDETWDNVDQNIEFLNEKTWIDYVKDIRLEISCGEAPYIVSRYDTVSGKFLNIKNRIGILDRKLRVINENCGEKEEWIKYSLIAFKSVYGFEWQGDNLLLARENLLLSYIDYYFDKFKELPSDELLIEVATIISWNIWQMDGLKGVIPESCTKERYVQINLFGEEDVTETICVGCSKGGFQHHNGIYSKIMDWEKEKAITYVSLLKGAM